MAGRELVAGESGGHRPAVLGADLLGHLLGLVVRETGKRAPEERQHEIVATYREVGERAGRRRVALRRASGATARETAGRDLEIAACGELVEMVAGVVTESSMALGDTFCSTSV